MFVVDKTGTQGRLRTFDTFTSAAIAALDAFRLAGNDEPRDNDAPIAMLIRVSPTLQAEMASKASRITRRCMAVRFVERGLRRE